MNFPDCHSSQDLPISWEVGHPTDNALAQMSETRHKRRLVAVTSQCVAGRVWVREAA